MTLATRAAVGDRRGLDLTWWAGYSVVMFAGLLLVVGARSHPDVPFLAVSLALLATITVTWIFHPRSALYAVLTLTVISDTVTAVWFPFVKNLSSRESISFVSDALTISPLDVALVTGAAISVVRRFARDRRLVGSNVLNRPILAFTLFVVYGFLRGLSTGGDLRVAVLVGRPFFYVTLVFVIVVNECVTAAHRRNAFIALLVGVAVQAALSIAYYLHLDRAERASLESLNEHGAVVAQNLLFVALIVMVLFGIRPRSATWALGVVALPVAFVTLVGQRRAGIAALMIGGFAIVSMLYWRRRRLFAAVVPAVIVLLVGYLGVFWNSTSSIGFPAQAVKTVIAPGSASAEDISSNLYREIEAYDLNATIRADPVAGFGFGRAFLRPRPLPDISVFELNAYVPHNSLLWVWISLGFLGFATTLYLVARAIVSGISRAKSLPLGTDFVVTMSATAFVIMYTVFSYLDVSWDARNTVLLGLALALCTAPVDPAGRDDQPSAAATNSSNTSASRSA